MWSRGKISRKTKCTILFLDNYIFYQHISGKKLPRPKVKHKEVTIHQYSLNKHTFTNTHEEVGSSIVRKRLFINENKRMSFRLIVLLWSRAKLIKSVYIMGSQSCICFHAIQFRELLQTTVKSHTHLHKQRNLFCFVREKKKFLMNRPYSCKHLMSRNWTAQFVFIANKNTLNDTFENLCACCLNNTKKNLSFIYWHFMFDSR